MTPSALRDQLIEAYPGLKLDLYESRGQSLTLSRIIAPQRGAGIGTRVMQSLVQYADQNGLRLELTPTNDFGGSVVRLKGFYARFGFVPNKGSHKDFSTMATMYRDARGPQLSGNRPSQTIDPLIAAYDEETETVARYVAEKYDLRTLGCRPTVDVRIPYEAVGSAVMRVVNCKRADLLTMLLDSGLPVDARFGGLAVNGVAPNSDGTKRHSLLMLCARHDFAEGMQVLLDRKADVLASCDDDGSTILDKAIEHEWVKGVETILQNCTLKELYGEKTAAEADGHQAPGGMFAVRDLDILDIVVTTSGMCKKGLLGRACWMYDDPKILDRLVALGCDVNDPGQEPIIGAATRGHVECLKRLLELGADVAIKNPKGRTLLQCAGKNTDVKEVLRAWKTGEAISAAFGNETAPTPAKHNMGVMAL